MIDEMDVWAGTDSVSKEGRTEPNAEGVLHIGSEGRWRRPAPKLALVGIEVTSRADQYTSEVSAVPVGTRLDARDGLTAPVSMRHLVRRRGPGRHCA